MTMVVSARTYYNVQRLLQCQGTLGLAHLATRLAAPIALRALRPLGHTAAAERS